MPTPKWVFKADGSLLSKRHDLLSCFTSRHTPVSRFCEMMQYFKGKSLGKGVVLVHFMKTTESNVSLSCGHCGGMMTHTQNLLWTSRQVRAHMHQEGMASFMTYILRLSGESRAGSQSGPKLAWERKEWKPAWLLLWLGGRQRWRFPHVSQSLCGLNFPLVSDRGTWAFLSAGPPTGQKGQGWGRGLKAVGSQTSKWGQTLYHTSLLTEDLGPSEKC